MRKIIISVLVMGVLLFIAGQILMESSSILKTVDFSFNVWRENIFPSLFPFFVLSEILIQYGFVELVGELFKPIMVRFFKIKGVCAFIFIMSMVSGFPSSAKYTRELYLKGLINESEASKVLTFTFFSNPLFILGTVAVIFLDNKEVGFLILLCHYIGNIIVGFVFRNFYPTNEQDCNFSLKTAVLNMHNKRISNELSFGSILTNSVVNSINTLLLVLGTITVFLVITTIIEHNINLSSYYQSILNGFVEMTQGLKYVSFLDIPLKLKCILTAMIISFGGFSVHMQIVSILSDTKISYFPFLVARLLHAFIASFLTCVLFDFWVLLL